MEIIDITPVINPKLAVFPGDTPFKQEFLMSFQKGHHLTLSTVQSTVHLGAHTDAPNHYLAEGESIEKRQLRIYLGSVQVIEVSCRPGQRICKEDLQSKKITDPRVLFKTQSFPDPYHWNSDFMSLSAELIEYLAQQKVLLVGIDTPSIDLADDKVLESHRAVARHNLAILEGIVLDKVDEGRYQLVALPLPIEGGDASPVRAVLLKDPTWKRS